MPCPPLPFSIAFRESLPSRSHLRPSAVLHVPDFRVILMFLCSIDTLSFGFCADVHLKLSGARAIPSHIERLRFVTSLPNHRFVRIVGQSLKDCQMPQSAFPYPNYFAAMIPEIPEISILQSNNVPTPSTSIPRIVHSLARSKMWEIFMPSLISSIIFLFRIPTQ